MASTFEKTRTVIINQTAGTGVVLYLGEEAYSSAKASGGVLKDTDFGKWVFANFEDGALVLYKHDDNITMVTITGTAAGGTTIESTAITK